jgi:hypothetical protein
MENLFRWSSCQADYFSSDDSSSEEEDNNEDIFDESDPMEESGDFDKRTGYTNKEVLEKLSDNGGDVELTVTEILQELTADSLDHLGSQDEEAKLRKIKILKRRVERLKPKLKQLNSRQRNQKLDDIFIAESQDSFVRDIKEEEAVSDDL